MRKSRGMGCEEKVGTTGQKEKPLPWAGGAGKRVERRN